MDPTDGENPRDIDCAETQKMAFAIFMFQGKAEYRWRTIKEGAEAAGEELTWKFSVEKLPSTFQKLLKIV